ncbi:MAG: hypothetical protein PHI88_00845 [Candidatus Pacebacteria bacterium]|nr:hypothetical protein [Candidatus Paceibacterota bacterium]
MDFEKPNNNQPEEKRELDQQFKKVVGDFKEELKKRNEETRKRFKEDLLPQYKDPKTREMMEGIIDEVIERDKRKEEEEEKKEK